MTQVALKIPDELLARVDRLVEDGTYPNRSAAIRAAVVDLVRRQQGRRVDAAFVAGFTAHPETEDEIAEATRLAIESIEEEPWKPWW